MNKKILLSVAAAATISTLLTGCGSSSSSDTATTTVDGLGEKSALNNALVTIGSGTDRTDSEGRFTVTGATGTDIVIEGGTFLESNGTANIATPFTDTLRATTVGNTAGAVNVLTTFVEIFSDAGSEDPIADIKALFGVTSIYQSVNTDGTPDLENKTRLFYQLLVDSQGNDVGRGNIISALRSNVNSGLLAALTAAYNGAGDSVTFTIPKASLAGFVANLDQPATAFAGMITNKIEPSEVNFTNYSVSFDNVLNLDTSNYTFETHGMIDTNHNLSYTAVSDINLQEPSMFDGDDLHPASADLYFSLVDLTTVAPTGETGTMTIEMKDLNGNASYKMSLSNLTVTSATSAEDDNNYVTLGMNENVSVSISAISDMNVSTHFSNSDLNITALCETNLIDSEEDGIELNLATFARYVRLNAEEDSSETNGNFSTAMVGNGNYSIKVNADFNSKSMSFGEGTAAYNKAPKYTTTVDGEEYTGYKILDANLNK